jgi:hypothetical protein
MRTTIRLKLLLRPGARGGIAAIVIRERLYLLD